MCVCTVQLVCLITSKHAGPCSLQKSCRETDGNKNGGSEGENSLGTYAMVVMAVEYM